MTGVIDVHAHILPGIDDGSRDWDESRRLLEESYRQGIRYIIATPHYSRRGLPSDIYDLSEKLKEEARKIAPDFQIGLGQETYYHEGLIENLKNGRALTLDGSQYVLVEFEPQVPYMKMYQAVRKLTMARYIPIIAHVERYACLREDSNMSELVQCDCRLQMNFSSLKRNSILDKEVRWCRKQVMRDRVYCLGTDMHRMDYRKPDIEESFQWLVKHLDGLKLHGLLRGNAKKVIQKRQYKIEKQENTKTYGKDL